MKSTDEIRLQVFLASAGIGSRRRCEELIREGRVAVEGKPAAIGMKVLLDSAVTLDGRPVVLESKKRYLALNKPPGFVSTMSDERNRPTAAGILRDSIPERVYNIGRLDQWSCGLLLFSNDGELTRALLHPSKEVEKEYLIHTDSPLPQGITQALERGVEKDGIRYKAKSAVIEEERTLRIVLTEGKNREVRNMLAVFGLRALVLRRTRFGPVLLGDLQEGAFRELNESELEKLQEYIR